MQAPGAKDTSAYYITPFLENIPLGVLTSELQEKYWTCSSTGNANGIDGVGVVTFKTDSSAGIAKLFHLEDKRPYAIDAGKLVLPPKAVESVCMLIA